MCRSATHSTSRGRVGHGGLVIVYAEQCQAPGTGDWKVARTGGLESPPYVGQPAFIDAFAGGTGNLRLVFWRAKGSVA